MKKSDRYFSINLGIVFALFFVILIFFPNQVRDVLVNLGPKAPKNVAIVVPHFDFAKDSRQKFIKQISTEIIPDKIIIVSTNHFNTGAKNIISDDVGWQIQGQSIKIDKTTNDSLKDKNLISNNHDLLLADHGIRSVISAVGPYFSDAQFLNLMIKSGTPEAELKAVSSTIKSECIKSSCLFVASVDFSHYGSNSLAQAHDKLSLSALYSLDQSKLKLAETDSPETLSLMADFAKSSNLTKFELFENSNSGLVQNNDQIETTSWIIGKYSEGPISANRSVTLTFAGDVMLDRMVNHEFKDKGFAHIFDKLGERVFWGSDISLVNLEGPISKTPIDDNITAGNLVFNFAPKSVDALKFLRLNTVSLANNHTSNAGASGLSDTKDILNANKIKYLGIPTGFSEDSVKRYETDFPISILAVNCLGSFDKGALAHAISKEKQAERLVVVYPHWGSEYLSSHTNSQKNLAYGWIDNGADLVIGSHPHVIEDSEIYKNKLVIYSLGNFVFDQTFSKETQEGLIVAITIDEKNTTASYLPIISNNFQPQFAKNDVREKILDLAMPKVGYQQKLRSDTIIINN